MKHRRGQKTRSPVHIGAVLAWLEANPGLHSAGSILQALGGRRHERRKLLALLADMADRGLLERHKGDRYRLAPRKKKVGTLQRHADGYGFVRVEGEEGADVFLPARELDGVMDGDRVAVIAWKDSRGRWEGRLERVLERARTRVVGIFHPGRRSHLAVPMGSDNLAPVEIPRGATRQAQAGQVVVVELTGYPERGRSATGVVAEVLGDADDPQVEVLSTAIRFGLPHRFAADVLDEAGNVSDRVAEADLVGRRDLRDRPFVTIDGATARDFDDAVQVEQTAEGYLLRVAIADVGHYVRGGSALDREARERGTSVYFPGACIPMLPERLSNGICSLNPDEDRLVLVAELIFDKNGAETGSDFYAAVMRSHARLTYSRVQAHLDGDPLELPAAEQLRAMAELAALLLQRRRAAGSLDLDLPEADIVLDLRGRPEAILKSERLFSHRIIEEFMLAANQAVARFLEAKGQAFPWRIHEPPGEEKLLQLQHYLAHFGLGFNLSREGVRPGDFAPLLEQVDADPALGRLVNQSLLRAMKQARYSADNLGHFGLAMEHYCHFTSPIRRYPDLLVHRALRQLLGLERKGETRDLEAICQQASACERRAMEAERDLVHLKKCQYMARHVGEDFEGVVSSVRPFGLFVELERVFVEGLVHVSRIEDDVYYFDEDLQRLVGYNRHTIFQIGDRLKVRVDRVDLEAQRIDFIPAE
ncbi:MAG: ribonuclease R [Geothermobacteraceae bacterium]